MKKKSAAPQVQRKKPGRHQASRQKVALIMGSDSDWKTLQAARDILLEFGVEVESKVVSAHRTPLEMVEFAKSARASGFGCIIAGAGGAAHLPGMVAALTELPVIGVPIPVGPMQGEDALYSIVQMPAGVPVACVAIGGAKNAALLAIQILGTGQPALLDAISRFKEGLRKAVLGKKLS
jgi:5-(carboxyamino)imidazole ribonucleotide mutase